jgi:hypothetical protein
MQTYRKWTKKELNLIAKGKVPPGRTYHQAATRAHKLGIPWGELRKDVSGRWDSDDKILLSGEIPKGRTWEAIRHRKNKLGLGKEDHPTYEEFQRLPRRRKNGKK